MIVAAEPRRPNSRHRASPRARRLLQEYGLREHDVTGSGPDGRIRRADVEAAAAAVSDQPRVDSRVDERPEAAVRPAVPPATPASPSTAFMAIEVDFYGIDRVRRSTADAPLDYLPFVARAVVDSLAAYPYLNARIGEQTVLVTRPVHLGVAVDLAPDGLVAPVIRDADSLRLPSLARQLATVVQQARAGRLGVADSGGGTFTISDSGPYGTLLTVPVLAPAQVAALATSAVRARPVAVEREPGEYAVAVHPVGTLGLSFDHSTIDSGYAARFLDRVRSTLEARDWTAEL